MVSKRVILPALINLTFVQLLLAQGSTYYSITQVDLSGNTSVAETVGPSPDPIATLSSGTDSTDFALEATYALDSLTLRTTAFLSIAGEVEDADNWKSIEAEVSATSELVDVVTVEGLPDGSAGTIEFNWVIDGSTYFELQDLDNATVTEYSSSSTLESVIPGAGGIVFDDTQSLPAGATSISDSFDVTGQAATFSVPFEVGTDLLVHFELSSRVDLAIEVEDETLGGGEFFAELFAEYGNSAVLDSVVVLDANGNVMDAQVINQDGFAFPTLPSDGGSPPPPGETPPGETPPDGVTPEPSSALVWATLGLVALARRRHVLLRRRAVN